MGWYEIMCNKTFQLVTMLRRFQDENDVGRAFIGVCGVLQALRVFARSG